MIAHLPNLDEILNRHEIPEKFWPEMHRLVEDGVRPCRTLVTRLNRVRNYKAALQEILTELSKPLKHQFPPADYQSPVSYESLRSGHQPMTARRLHAILKRHQIDPKFWPEFRAMVELGQTPGKELWTRMNHVANFRAARNEIAAELSKGLDHEFPPEDYEVPEGYDFDRGPAKSTRARRP